MGYKLGGRISVIYPFYVTTFVWGTFIAVYLEKEVVHWPTYLGLAFLLTGLTLIASQGVRP